MITECIFLKVLAALWLVGSALGLGLYQSRKASLERFPLFGYVWVAVFSWAFVGWLAGELMAYSYKANLADDKIKKDSSQP